MDLLKLDGTRYWKIYWRQESCPSNVMELDNLLSLFLCVISDFDSCLCIGPFLPKDYQPKKLLKIYVNRTRELLDPMLRWNWHCSSPTHLCTNSATHSCSISLVQICFNSHLLYLSPTTCWEKAVCPPWMLKNLICLYILQYLLLIVHKMQQYSSFFSVWTPLFYFLL